MREESAATGVSFCAAADTLLNGVVTDHWGQTSLSVYETARLVAIAPWLEGHRARLEFLLRTQGADGGWGAPDGYALIPTLSATGALLSAIQRDPTGVAPARIAAAGDAGLRALRRMLDDAATP